MNTNTDLDLLKNIGLRIKQIRNDKNISLKDLAYSIGMEPPNLSVIENGKSNPQILTYAKIASALNIDIKQLFDFNFDYHILKDKSPVYSPRKHK
ncbi:MAG: hypothetical protein RLZZ414_1161 [Bacteroidota bacterium]|jgi:transcriptional regulator with XRE-family HTH domain